MKELENEDQKLKQLVADQALDILALNDLVKTTAAQSKKKSSKSAY